MRHLLNVQKCFLFTFRCMKMITDIFSTDYKLLETHMCSCSNYNGFDYILDLTKFRLEYICLKAWKIILSALKIIFIPHLKLLQIWTKTNLIFCLYCWFRVDWISKQAQLKLIPWIYAKNLLTFKRSSISWKFSSES